MINHNKIFVKKSINFIELLDKALLKISEFFTLVYVLICKNAEGKRGRRKAGIPTLRQRELHYNPSKLASNGT